MFGGRIGLPELLIILVVVLLLFGVGRISKISEELGKSIRAFRKGMSGEEENKKEEDKKDNGSGTPS
ncbi:MAG: twin-arginine translocase TatA/TatE family subunit [Anaerolineaceae bacterium]|jgi:sec-independent protein translocase protein TatA